MEKFACVAVFREDAEFPKIQVHGNRRGFFLLGGGLLFQPKKTFLQSRHCLYKKTFFNANEFS